MSAVDPHARQVLAIVSIVLREGERVDRLSRGLTVASLAGMVAAGMLVGRPALPGMLLLGAAALAGLAEIYLAARVGIDAALFQRLAAGADDPDWAVLDAALTRLGMLPAAKAGRPAAARIAGAARLLRWQIAALLVQLGFLIACAFRATMP